MKMICFDIEINGTKVCTSGIDQFGSMSVTMNLIRRRAKALDAGQHPSQRGAFEDLHVRVGGMIRQDDGGSEYLDWLSQNMNVGDELRIRISEKDSFDHPIRRPAAKGE